MTEEVKTEAENSKRKQMRRIDLLRNIGEIRITFKFRPLYITVSPTFRPQ